MIKVEADVTGIEKIEDGEIRIETDRAHGFYNKIHFMIVPAPHGGTGFHVFFTEDDLGKPDFSKIRNSLAIDGNVGDLQEIADVFMRRLVSGVPIENIFQDLEEASAKLMKDIYERLKK